ncbi:stage II sporulation protein M [Desmospora profundinema]|uniref:Stage II sporulation protein M n=1 Tax=Desmospora profundinema TaxID=1571184 RepID=A0ABU1IT15_9BACL|nr:stage II sporulation protein M [Desmospora profundinema]MDR6226915.1 stage II sporulation protein M [Desmospora profundinema]
MRRFLASVWEDKNILIFATFVFLFTALAGFAGAETLGEALMNSPMWEEFEKTLEEIQENPTFANAFITIFINNVTASLLMVVFGLFFGVFPLMALVTNGMLLGVVLGIASGESGANPFVLFVTTILPHGTLELPAILIAATFGIRLGMTVSRSIVGLFSSTARTRSVEDWKGIRRRALPILLGILVLLFFAALIEAGLITLLSDLA